VKVKVSPPPPRVLLFILGLLVVFFGLVFFLSRLPADGYTLNALNLAFWAGLIWLAQRTTVKLPFGASMSHTFVVALAAMVLFPPWLAPALVFIFSRTYAVER